MLFVTLHQSIDVGNWNLSLNSERVSLPIQQNSLLLYLTHICEGQEASEPSSAKDGQKEMCGCVEDVLVKIEEEEVKERR